MEVLLKSTMYEQRLIAIPQQETTLLVLLPPIVFSYSHYYPPVIIAMHKFYFFFKKYPKVEHSEQENGIHNKLLGNPNVHPIHAIEFGAMRI